MADAPPVILASRSPARARLLRAAGVDVHRSSRPRSTRSACATRSRAEGVPAEDAAVVLAELKAAPRRRPGRPRVPSCSAPTRSLDVDGEWLEKPMDRAAAPRPAAPAARPPPPAGERGRGLPRRSRVWHHVEVAARLDAAVQRRLPRAAISTRRARRSWARVGAYQLEGLGAQLMARVDGDFFTVLGLPLLPAAAVPARPGCADDVIVLGLTGSIAMGKSRAAAAFRALRRAGLRRRCRGPRADGSGRRAPCPRSRRPSPAASTTAGGVDRAALGPAVSSATRRRCVGWRRSSTRWSGRAEGRFPRAAAAVPARRSPSSTSRSCSRPRGEAPCRPGGGGERARHRCRRSARCAGPG